MLTWRIKLQSEVVRAESANSVTMLQVSLEHFSSVLNIAPPIC